MLKSLPTFLPEVMYKTEDISNTFIDFAKEISTNVETTNLFCLATYNKVQKGRNELK